MTETLSLSVYHMAANFVHIGYKAKILAITYPPSAYTARMVAADTSNLTSKLSKFRPPTNVLTITQDLRVAREINLLWGVRSVYIPELTAAGDLEHRNLVSIKKIQELSLLGNDVCAMHHYLTLVGPRHLCFPLFVGKAFGFHC